VESYAFAPVQRVIWEMRVQAEMTKVSVNAGVPPPPGYDSFAGTEYSRRPLHRSAGSSQDVQVLLQNAGMAKEYGKLKALVTYN
jgi:hypothetical protein